MKSVASVLLIALGLGTAAASEPPEHHPASSAEEVPSETKPASPPAARSTLTLTLGGDLGLGPHGAAPEATGSRRHGRFLDWADLTSGLRPLLDGDLNFANLETVVTARLDLVPNEKTFTFRSHPDGVAHLARIGFNLISTANNHAIDYGLAGLRETVRHLDDLRARGLVLAHAGVGGNRDAAGRPQDVTARGWRIGFSALGIASGGRAGADRPGIMAWRAPEDVAETIRRLAEAPADYRILSVHQGQERNVNVDRDTIRTLRQQAVAAGNIDLVVGHHAHVVQGVEISNGRLIFYGLGNLLHPGMQDMGAFGICQDYGLMARVHLAQDGNGRLVARAVEAIPLTDMHWQARPLTGDAGRLRIAVLNHLAGTLDDADGAARGLRFAPQANGTGLYCAEGASLDGGRVGRLCGDWAGVPTPDAGTTARVRAACGASQLVARTRGQSVPTSARSAPVAFDRPTPSADRRWVGSVFAGN